MHSHHSHSGQYILHGSGLLEDMVLTAAEKGFTHYCLTEHMPRHNNAYLYPEEKEKNYSLLDLEADFATYLNHARRIQRSRESMHILVGFEVEGVDLDHILAAKQLRKVTDMCVGSTHHVHGIPIDFDSSSWSECMSISGSPRRLFLDYFALQAEMIRHVQPDVVGHFDLIRLLLHGTDLSTGKPLADVHIETDWPDVWAALSANIELVVSYGGLFELNSSAFRKGWLSPYPQLDICRRILDLGGRFCLSDDAHTVAQVGLNYSRMWEFIMGVLKLQKIYHLERSEGRAVVVENSVQDLAKHVFWTS